MPNKENKDFVKTDEFFFKKENKDFFNSIVDFFAKNSSSVASKKASQDKEWRDNALKNLKKD